MKSVLSPFFYIIGTFLISLVILILLLMAIFSITLKSPTYINDKSEEIKKVKIQPKEALKLAEPYLDEHATYSYRDDKNMKTHIVKLRKWYYVRKTNYPAKTTRYYMNNAIKINSKTGEVILPKQKNHEK